MALPTPEKTPRPPGRHTVADAFNGLIYSFRDWFKDFFNLKEGMDREGTIISIKTNKRMRGANAWLLVCSIMIASLGLDLNSPAVIIGAMLISPLMSPILGIGMAVGINDRETLYISFRHFVIAMGIALVTSTVYFWISPLDQITDEIKGRTAPTILDVGVAIFGGLAGIISTTRKDKSNAIPGVAIATALMPPLCVTGFGIANGYTSIAVNSFYLFFLNSFAIAGTTYLIIRLLNFPYKSYVDPDEFRRTRLRTIIFSLLLVIPSLFIFKNVWQKLRYDENVRDFVDTYFPRDCINSRIYTPGLNLSDPYNIQNEFSRIFSLSNQIPYDSSVLILQLINRTVPIDSFAHYERIMREEFKLRRTSFRAIPDYGIELDKLDQRLQRGTAGQYEALLDSIGAVAEQQESVMQMQQLVQDSLLQDSLRIQRLQAAALGLNPYLEAVGLAREQLMREGKQEELVYLRLEWKPGLTARQRNQYEQSIRSFIQKEAGLDTLILNR